MEQSVADCDRLPPSLHRVYQRYKIGTGVVIDWLISKDTTFNGNNAKSKHVSLPVREILSIAERISSRHVKVPVKIQITFKSVLVDRRFLTNTYEQSTGQSQANMEATERHKHFNDTLAKAYDALCPTSSGPKHPHQRKLYSKAQAAPLECANRFDVLTSLIEKESDSHAFSAQIVDDKEEENDSHRSSIADDPLSVAISLHAYVLEIERMLEDVRRYWRLAAQEKLPIVFAGWLTNLAFRFIGMLSSEYGPQYGYHGGLVQEYVFKKCIRISEDPDKARLFFSKGDEAKSSSMYRDFRIGHGFVWPCHVLYDFRTEKMTDSGYMAVAERQRIEKLFDNPSQTITLEADFLKALDEIHEKDSLDKDQLSQSAQGLYDSRYQKDADAVQSVLRSLGKIQQGSSPIHEFMRSKNMVPLLGHFECYLEQPGRLHTSFVVGLHMLLESCKAFLWSDEDDMPNRVNCRVNVLRFGREVVQSFTDLFAAEEDNIMRDTHDLEWFSLMKGYHEDLKLFTSEINFDLHAQAPWVAGSQLSAMLGNVQEAGMQLLNRKGIFGSVLHLYNMIRQVGPECPLIPLLETFCDLFGRAVFLGDATRPKKNFNNILNVYLGGSIRHRPGQRAAVIPPWLKSRDDDVTWQKLRIHPHDLTFLANHCMDCALSGGKFWAQLATDGKDTRRSRDYDKTHTGEITMKLSRQHSQAEIMENARALLERDFAGDAPLGKLNCFKVYKLCLEIWKDIAVRICEPSNSPFVFLGNPFPFPSDPTVTNAMVFYQAAILDVDALAMEKHTAAKLKQRRPLLMMRDAMVSVCEDKKVEDFLWKGV